MKRLLVITAALLAAVGVSACAAVRVSAEYSGEIPELVFKPVGGGKYIYCNNPEALDSNTLMNSDKPRYVMNNDNLGPGKYYIYLSHYNFIAMDSGGEHVSKDMELDVELTPVSGECEYTISNVGFQTATGYAYYDENNNIVKKEPEWGLFDCCAAAMNKSIIDIDSEDYYPWNGENKISSVKASQTKWLSEYIPNYSVVHYRRPVHMQAILEIKSGHMNVNVCAFESTGKLRDRSTMRTDAEKGLVRYDRTIKGIADTLPQVEAELEYTIDDDTKDGDCLPVTMHNQYAPDGVVNYDWITHIAALDDPWAKALADETGMLPFTYEDDNKLTYYGKKVPESERDNIWRFDTHHTDTHEYEGQPGTTGADTYSPNYEITAKDEVNGYATNLGNYGITYTYNMTVKNNSSRTRYITYEPTTQSNIIVYTNENGEESSHAFSKNFSYDYKQDVMSAVELPKGETTKFSVNVILPVNYNGGIRNAFVIHDNEIKLDFNEVLAKHKFYKEAPFIKEKLLSEYKDKLPEATLHAFEGTLENYEVLDCGDFYALRWCLWDGSPESAYGAWWLVQHLYILDDDFNMIGYHTFGDFPTGMSYNNGKLYIATYHNGIYSTKDGKSYSQETKLSKLPEHIAPVRIEPIKEEKKEKLIVNGEVPDWAKQDFELFSVYGLGDGLSSEQGEPITREAFCGLAANVIRYTGAVSLPSKPKAVFSDTDKGEIRQLAELGIITGYEDGSFKPDNTITREEAAIILSRMAGLYDFNETKELDYRDIDDISRWAKDGVRICAGCGIMNGVGEEGFLPKGDYTTIQSEITMLRMFNMITNSGKLSLPEIPKEGTNYTVYREGYRGGRIELAVYDTEGDSTLVNDKGILTVSGSYSNDKKYYFSSGEWVKFEEGYDKISNNAESILISGRLQ